MNATYAHWPVWVKCLLRNCNSRRGLLQGLMRSVIVVVSPPSVPASGGSPFGPCFSRSYMTSDRTWSSVMVTLVAVSATATVCPATMKTNPTMPDRCLIDTSFSPVFSYRRITIAYVRFPLPFSTRRSIVRKALGVNGMRPRTYSSFARLQLESGYRGHWFLPLAQRFRQQYLD